MEQSPKINQITERTIQEMRLYTNFSVLSSDQVEGLRHMVSEVARTAIKLEENRDLNDEQLFQFVATAVFSVIGLVKDKRGLDTGPATQN